MPPKRKLEKTDDISEDNVVLFDPYQVICDNSIEVCSAKDHERKKNCSKNPWCIFGLGEKKEGIWRNSYVNYFQTILGPDPSLRTRNRSKEINICNISCNRLTPPVGLENLGATCYVNVLVQSLYHNLLVRNSILSMELVEDPYAQSSVDADASSHMNKVLLALQTTFVYMSDSLETTYNLQHFVELLGLNRGEQQDPIEFSKLFVSRLESLNFPNKTSSETKKRGPSLSLTLLLQGSLTYRTACCDCRTASQPKVSAFLELEVNIEGQTTLCAAIANSFQDEPLLGDNRYHCSRCGGKRDAIRSTALQSLPAVLSLQLLRYVYDRSSGQKKKLQNRVQFPARLNLAPYGGSPDDGDYVLVAVLYHKGPSAYGGHYVAETLDWAFGDWWHCDDGTVFKVQCPAESDSDAIVEVPLTSSTPVGSVCNSKVDSEAKKMQVVDLCSDVAIDVDDIDAKDDEVQVDARRSPSKPSTRQPAHLNRARDVYMLSYVREKEMQAAIAIVGVKGPAPPGVSKILQLSNSRHDEERMRYQRRRRRLKVRAEHRKMEFDELVSSVKRDSEFYLIRTEFIKKWIVGDPSTLRVDRPLDDDEDDDDDDLERSSRGEKNGGVGCEVQQLNALCEHGTGLAPNAIESFKVVSSASYAVLTTTAEAKVDWIINYENYRCPRCYDGAVAKRQNLQDQQRFLKAILDILDTAESVTPPAKAMATVTATAGSGFWVAKSFIKYVKNAHAAHVKASLNKTSNAAKKSPQEFFLPHTQKTGEQPASSNIESTVDPNSERVNSSLLCPQHLSEQVLASSPPIHRAAVLLSTAAWIKLCDLLPYAIAFPESAAPCPVCALRDGDEQLTLRRAREVRTQELKQKYMQQLSKARKVNASLSQRGETCYLVDGVWLAYWRQWLGDVTLSRPPPLTNYRLRCDHGLLLVCQSFLVATLFSSNNADTDVQVDGSEEGGSGISSGSSGMTGDLAVKSLEDMGYDAETFALQTPSHQSCSLDAFPAVEILSQSQWYDLLARFNCSSEDDESGGQIVDLQYSQEDLNSSEREVFEVRLTGTDSKGREWQPFRCDHCCCAIEKAQEKSKRCYRNAEIIIKLLGHERDLSVHTSISSSVIPTTATISKRTRSTRVATRRATTYKVRMDSSDRISLLKLRLFEMVTARDLPPARQRLYNEKGEELKSDNSTLIDCGVRAGDTLLLVPVEAQTGTDGDEAVDLDGWNESVLASLADYEGDNRTSSRRDPERGFGGTFLLSSSSSQQQQQLEVVDIS